MLAGGHIAPAGIERARRVAAQEAAPLCGVLTRLGLVGEATLARVLAQVLHLPLFRPNMRPAAPLFADELNAEFLLRRTVLPLQLQGAALLVAVADPFDAATLSLLAGFTGLDIRPAVGGATEIEGALRALYRPESAPPQEAAAAAELSAQVERDADTLRELGSEAPVIRFVQQMIERAVELRASDLHLEPVETTIRLRYRIDGALRDMDPPAWAMYAGIVSRIKILARLNYAERRRPQDGRLRIVVRGQEYDFRVSILPALHGESVAIRVLDRHGIGLDFRTLGFAEADEARLQALLDRPNGMMLLAGPTGSGKTTTLYAALQRLNQPDRKILTIEDPIEYHLPGIVQMQVDASVDVRFANVLRSFLRHDPDVIMVGEIRDGETARTSIQAALTGHLVVSSVHANTGVATLSRLRDMGVEDYLLSATLNGVISQRLVRRLCPHCRIPYAPEPRMAERLGLHRFARDPRLWRPAGCAQCDGIGFRGRVVIAEILALDDALRDAVSAQRHAVELERLALAGGMRPIRDDGLQKAVAGLTTVDEVARVTLA